MAITMAVITVVTETLIMAVDTTVMVTMVTAHIMAVQETKALDLVAVTII